MLIPDFGELSRTYQEIEYEIKKSLFIARLYSVLDKEQAKQAVENSRLTYPDARHHCWAYVISSGSSAAMSDDGEPSGTAGKPILNILQHKNVSEVIVVVSRYFGGVKLGAGGLVRSYVKAAQLVIDAVNLIEPVSMVQYKLEFEFASEQLIRHWLMQVEGELLSLEYKDKVFCLVSIPEQSSITFINNVKAHSINYKDLD